MTQLTVENLFTCFPFYFAKVIAGPYSNKPSFSSVCFDEVPCTAHTLLFLKSEAEQVDILLNALTDERVAAIYLYGLETIYLPSSVEEASRKFQKPIYFLSNPDGEGLHQRINELFQLKEANLFHYASEQFRDYWIYLFNRKGIKDVFKRMDELLGTEIAFFNNQKVFQNIRPSLLSKNDFKSLKVIREKQPSLPPEFKIVDNGTDHYYLFQMLSPNKKIIGYFLFKKITPTLTQFQLDILYAMTPTMVTWVKQSAVTKSVHLKYKDQFLYDVLNNNMDSEQEMIEMAKNWNMAFTPNAQVFAIDLNGSIPITKDVIIRLQSILQPDVVPFQIYTTYLSHRIVGIIFPTDASTNIDKREVNLWIKRRQKKIQKFFPELQTIFGIGRVHQSNIELHQSFQEAKIAIQMYDYTLNTKGYIHYDDIGYIRLLSYIHDDLLSDFSLQYLQILIAYDQENEADLVETLNAYCNHNGDIMQTAQYLFIHPNTLRQRLKKVQSVLQVDLDNYTDLINLMIALKIRKNMEV